MTSVFGQSSFTTSYTVNFPMGKTHDYISKTSFRGFSIDYKYYMDPQFAIGISSGWYTFYQEKDKALYTGSEGNASVYGKQFRYINSAPILFVADYFFKSEENLSPFIGLGVGTTYNRVDNRMSQLTSRWESWQFSLAPEVGIRFGYDFGMAGYLSARYNQCFKTNDLSNQSYLSLNIGLMYN